MAGVGILEHLLPGGADLVRLQGLVGIEKRLRETDPLRRLAALRFGKDNAALSERLKLSNLEKERLTAITARENGLRPDLSSDEARSLIYAIGSRRFRDLVLLYEAGGEGEAGAEPWRRLCILSETWTPPEFPLRGADILAAGAMPGKAVGALLRDLESWWIERDFAPDRAALLDELGRRMAGYQK